MVLKNNKFKAHILSFRIWRVISDTVWPWPRREFKIVMFSLFFLLLHPMIICTEEWSPFGLFFGVWQLEQFYQEIRKLDGAKQETLCSKNFRKLCNLFLWGAHNEVSREQQWIKTSQELQMLSSVTINCQVTIIVMNSGSQLSEL